jgi:hypothetical protein
MFWETQVVEFGCDYVGRKTRSRFASADAIENGAEEIWVAIKENVAFWRALHAVMQGKLGKHRIGICVNGTFQRLHDDPANIERQNGHVCIWLHVWVAERSWEETDMGNVVLQMAQY